MLPCHLSFSIIFQYLVTKQYPTKWIYPLLLDWEDIYNFSLNNFSENICAQNFPHIFT